MDIREANEQDFENIWPIFHEVVSAGETYAYDPDTTQAQALELWVRVPRKTFVCEEDGQILGTYYLKTNQPGFGNHVSNCGYMVSSKARGRGVARKLCEHSQKSAKTLGYKAMQFNFVVSTNEVAVQLWRKLGFQVVGTLPKAFNHPVLGFVDVYVMYQWL